MGDEFGSASLFDRQVSARLSRLGFHLTNDTSERQGNFHETRAEYQLSCGLQLKVGFGPTEERAAAVAFGRLWTFADGAKRLSNSLFKFAEHYGWTLAEYYPLTPGIENVAKTNETIITDLEAVIPKILTRLSSSDLEAIENEQYGAANYAKKVIGADYLARVQIAGTDITSPVN